MLKEISSSIVILLMIGLIIYVIFRHFQCKITYQLETETPYTDKDLELNCKNKSIFRTKI